MSAHPSLRSRRLGQETGVKLKSHPGQNRGSARKRLVQSRRRAIDQEEAARLGINVSRLRAKRAAEAEDIRAHPPAPPTSLRNGYGGGDYRYH